jgi:hypothetical protein
VYRIPSKCVVRHIIISSSEIHFLRFIMEAYQGICLVTTLDPKLGLVQLSIAPGCEDDVERILKAEKENLKLRTIAPVHQEDTSSNPLLSND